MKLILPPRQEMRQIHHEDPLPYYYMPIVGWIYRKRLQMALDAIGSIPTPMHDLLEIGYGSGVFFPTLALIADRLYGLDLHPDTAIVSEMLTRRGIHAELKVGDLLDMDYKSESFDGIICLSVLEHLPPVELEKAIGEIERVARKGAIVILGFPGKNLFNNSFYRLVGFQEDTLHPSGHAAILRAIDARLKVTKVLSYPAILPAALRWYWVCRAEKQ